MKNEIFSFLSLAILIATGCTKNDAPVSQPTSAQLTVTSISPNSGGGNTLVTITGTNFKTNPTENIVKFNGVTATVQTATSNTLTVLVPIGAGSGTITISTNSGNSIVTGPIFSYSAIIGTATVVDIEGNVYHTVKIGTQTWMVENLKTTKYRNGESIPNVTDNTVWTGLSTGAWCNYNNEIINGTKYGKLYNWYVIADTRNITPVGWHVSTDADWTILENYLIANGYNFDGTITGNRDTNNKMAKSLASGTSDWDVSTYIGDIGNNLTKNNSTGFSALPGGSRFDLGDGQGTFSNGSVGHWWCSQSSMNSAWGRVLYSCQNYVLRYNFTKPSGLSIRCVKD